MQTLLGSMVATVLTAALTVAHAHATDAPLQCTTDRNGNWTITAIGPTSVPCPDGGECTALDYHIVANTGRTPTYIAILVEHDVDVVSPASELVSVPCAGDRRTRLGLHDCSSQTVRIQGGATTFQIVVRGRRNVVGSSLAVRASRARERCLIASLGKDVFDPNEQIVSSERIDFKGCTVTIPTDLITGEGAPATITGDNCVFVANARPVSESELKINGQSVGALTFGKAAIASGTSSCTTKVVSRKLYTWCTCDDTTGDGVPEDPIPPCPATVPVS